MSALAVTVVDVGMCDDVVAAATLMAVAAVVVVIGLAQAGARWLTLAANIH